MRSYKLTANQQGVSLVELLIASALGVIIIFGVTRAMSSMNQSSRTQLDQNALQQTADLALSYLTLRLRNAISTPCNQYDALEKIQVNPITEAGKISAATQAAISRLVHGIGISIEQVPVSTTSIAIADDNGSTLSQLTTDNISIISTEDRLRLAGQTSIPESGASATSTLYIATKFPSSSYDNKKLYAITDCRFMDIFRAKRASSGSGTVLNTAPNTTFLTNYRGDNGALVSRFSASTIGIDSNGNLYDKPIFKTTAGNTLMNEIALIRVIFGIDVNGDDGIVDRYITAAQLNNLAVRARVVTAEIYLLAQLTEGRPNTAIPDRYTLMIPDTTKPLPASGGIPTQTLTITDNIMRKVFTRSVTFRNQVRF